MDKQDKLWNLLTIFILGCAMAEYAGRSITSLETVHNEYSSLRHHIYTVLLTIGFCQATWAIMTIYVKVCEVTIKYPHKEKPSLKEKIRRYVRQWVQEQEA